MFNVARMKHSLNSFRSSFGMCADHLRFSKSLGKNVFVIQDANIKRKFCFVFGLFVGVFQNKIVVAYAKENNLEKQGEIYFNRGEYREALNFFRISVEEYPERLLSRMMYVITLLKSKDFPEAIAFIDETILKLEKYLGLIEKEADDYYQADKEAEQSIINSYHKIGANSQNEKLDKEQIPIGVAKEGFDFGASFVSGTANALILNTFTGGYIETYKFQINRLIGVLHIFKVLAAIQSGRREEAPHLIEKAKEYKQYWFRDEYAYLSECYVLLKDYDKAIDMLECVLNYQDHPAPYNRKPFPGENQIVSFPVNAVLNQVKLDDFTTNNLGIIAEAGLQAKHWQIFRRFPEDICRSINGADYSTRHLNNREIYRRMAELYQKKGDQKRADRVLSRDYSIFDRFFQYPSEFKI